MPGLPNHPTVTLQIPIGDYPTEVDKELADLISACWEVQIFTSECCQEAGPGMAHIGFMSLGDMETFYFVLTRDAEDDALFHAWKWDLWADGGIHGDVYFPRTHIDWATERVRKYLAEAKERAAEMDAESPGQQ